MHVVPARAVLVAVELELVLERVGRDESAANRAMRAGAVTAPLPIRRAQRQSSVPDCLEHDVFVHFVQLHACLIPVSFGTGAALSCRLLRQRTRFGLASTGLRFKGVHGPRTASGIARARRHPAADMATAQSALQHSKRTSVSGEADHEPNTALDLR